MKLKRELSGCTVRILPFVTIKTGNADTALQGRKMMGLREQLGGGFEGMIPRVYKVWSNGYAMQTLESIPRAEWDWKTVYFMCMKLWCKKESDFYTNAPRFNEYATWSYLARMKSPLLHFMPSQPWFKLRYSAADELTHGDPTHENTMINGDRYALIDWQSVRRSFRPAHRDVDCGRLLQSILGWRNVGERYSGNIMAARELLAREPNCWFWACFNYERIRSTTKDKAMQTWCASQSMFIINHLVKA